MRDLTNEADVDALLRESVAILLKHGATCPVSAGARDELAAWASSNPGVAIGGIEVTGRRELSDLVAERLATPHASPQLFVLERGEVRWRGQHREISADAIARQVGRIGA